MIEDGPPNIILFVLDTARAKDISIYNESIPQTTPFFDSFAGENILYEQCITEAPWTLPAHASLFTGKLPHEHGVNSWEDRLPKSEDTLASQLSEAGYQTVGITNNSWVSNLFGLSKGFNDFYKLWQLIQADNDLIETSRNIKSEPLRETVRHLFDDTLLSGNPIVNMINGLYGKLLHNRNDHGAKRTNRIIKNWINKEWEQERPYFLFANYLEPHLDYDPPKEHAEKFLSVEYEEAMSIPQTPVDYIFGNRTISDDELQVLRELYQAELHYLDSKLKEVFEFLRESGSLENTVVVMVGDHGENIGEFGLMSHFYSLHESVLRVPCAVRYPSNQSENVAAPIQLTDLHEFIRNAALDPESPSDVSPQSISREETISELLGVNPTEQAVVRRTENNYDEYHFKELARQQWAVRRNGRKAIRRDNSDTVYSIEGHRESQISSQEEQLSSILDSIDSEINAASSSTVDGATESRLRDLGYL